MAAISSPGIPKLPEHRISKETSAMCHLVGKPGSLVCSLTVEASETGRQIERITMNLVLQPCGGTPKQQQQPQCASLNPHPAFESLAGDGLFYTAGFSPCCASSFTHARASRRLVWDESLNSSENYISLALNTWCRSSTGVQAEPEFNNVPVPMQTVYHLKITLLKAAVPLQQKLLTLSSLGA